jgi:hypothetical protein
VQVEQLSPRCPPELRWKPADGCGRSVVEQVLGQGVAEVLNHDTRLSERDNRRKVCSALDEASRAASLLVKEIATFRAVLPAVLDDFDGAPDQRQHVRVP